jgi:hypothetical protein
VFTVTHAEMFKFPYKSSSIKETTEIQEFLDDMETEVCNHYAILINSKSKSHTTYPRVIKLEL